MLRLITTAFVAAFVLAATGLASAADVAKKAPADAYALSGPTFGGFYIGPSIGYAWSGLESASGIPGDDLHIDGKGWTLGGQSGVNFQHGQVVVGIEVDATWTDVKGRLEGTGCNALCSGVSGKYDLLGSLRGRFGMTVINPSTLVYGTAGLGFGKSHVADPIFMPSGVSTNKFGWVVGGGVEVLLSQHWTARTQFLRYDFGKDDIDGSPTKNNVVNLATMGLNFKF